MLEKDEFNDSLAKIKTTLSQNYEKLRIVDSDKTQISSTLKSLNKDINEIDEKLRKDEGRKVKIQEELDNLNRQKDSAANDANKFLEEHEKLEYAIEEKKMYIERAHQ